MVRLPDGLRIHGEFGADFAFPASSKIISPMPISQVILLRSELPGIRRGDTSCVELSINDWVRSGHMYGSWLALVPFGHAGLPHIIGEVYSSGTARMHTHLENAGSRGVENANMDFRDVWATCIAHENMGLPKFGGCIEKLKLKTSIIT
jgi:hypothetical protein